MKRLVLISLLVAPPALAANHPVPKACKLITVLSVPLGNQITGPIDVTDRDGISVFRLDAGASVSGPLTVSVCAGKKTSNHR